MIKILQRSQQKIRWMNGDDYSISLFSILSEFQDVLL